MDRLPPSLKDAGASLKSTITTIASTPLRDTIAGVGSSISTRIPDAASLAEAISIAGSSISSTFLAITNASSQARTFQNQPQANKTFQTMHTEAERLQMSKAILAAHPDFIPVILRTPANPCRKLNVPRNITFGEFAYQRHKKMRVPPEKSVYFLVAGELPLLAWTMAQVYEEYADFDRFLYVTMCEENTFGA